MTEPRWPIESLRNHLQYAVDLEFWTIGYYMTAMYSIVEPSHEAYQLIQSVVNQEMLHCQLAANIANAYGVDVTVGAPTYGDAIPHLDFALDNPERTEPYTPYDSHLGPLDALRINTMCLVELPEDGMVPPDEMKSDCSEYGSIGQFYEAVRMGAEEHQDAIQAGRNQVDFFSRYYADFGTMTITESGAAGWAQVESLIDTIVEQGEGQNSRHTEIPPALRNTADDPAAVLDHFDKFLAIRDNGRLPETFALRESNGSGLAPEQQRILDNFISFRSVLETVFGGGWPAESGFHLPMTTLGANFRTCWQQGVVPVLAKSDSN